MGFAKVENMQHKSALILYIKVFLEHAWLISPRISSS